MEEIFETVANDLYEYLGYIRKMPGLYLGGKSLSALDHFIRGYQTACGLKGIEERLNPDFALFHDFVYDYYAHGPHAGSSAGWKSMILSAHYCREEDAFNSFFTLLDLFRENYYPINSKKVAFTLLGKMVSEQDGTLSLLGSNTDVIKYLRALPTKLQNVQSSYDYEEIFDEVKELANKCQPLANMISEIIGSADWAESLED